MVKKQCTLKNRHGRGTTAWIHAAAAAAAAAAATARIFAFARNAPRGKAPTTERQARVGQGRDDDAHRERAVWHLGRGSVEIGHKAAASAEIQVLSDGSRALQADRGGD
jgi:hypothetical protein